MKSIRMDRDYTYMPSSSVHIEYKSGITYHRVPEAAAEAILGAGAGSEEEVDEHPVRKKAKASK